MKKNFLLIALIVQAITFCGLNGYIYKVTNLTDLAFTIKFVASGKKSYEESDKSGAAMAGIVGTLSPVFILAATCEATFPKEAKVEAGKILTQNSVHCCITSIKVYGAFQGKEYSEWDRTYHLMTQYDNGDGCKGVDLFIHKSSKNSIQVTKSAEPTDYEKNSVVSQAAIKEAKEMEAQASSGNIDLKFIPLKHISVEVQNSILSQNTNSIAKNADKSGLLHGYLKTIPNFKSISAAELETAEDMITAGLLEQKNSKDETPLLLAVKNGARDWALFLARHKANPFAINKDGQNALHLAATNGDRYLIQLLIKLAQLTNANNLNALINAKDKSGNTPFDYVFDLDAIKIFMDPKKTGNIKAEGNINKLNPDGFSRLHLASSNNALDVLKLLLEQNGIDINIAGKNDIRPLHLAVQMAAPTVRKSLKEKQADIAKKNEAAPKNALENVKLLLNKGANPSIADKNGNTPLHIAAELQLMDIIKEITGKGTSLNPANKEGVTPLILAAQKNNIDLVKELITRGANVNQADNNSVTPLLIAAQIKNIDLAKELLSKNADINHQNKEKRTALHLATLNKDKDMIKLLLEKGAKVDIKDSLDKTAYDLAKEKDYIEIGALLQGSQEKK